MTHDELLAKIKEMNPYVAIGGDRWKQEQALRAVVELHKPFHDQVLDCVQCKVEFPCPTIQAIESALQ